jgi:hypothetical protein
VEKTNVAELAEHEMIPEIFKKQHELFLKYHAIETKNGFYKPSTDLVGKPPIDDPQFQHWVKDMLWRATEEVSEAMECIPDFNTYGDNFIVAWDSDADLRHFFEEFADALHFLTEVSLICGVDPMKLYEYWAANVGHRAKSGTDSNSVQEAVLELYIAVGLVGNTLKNKPWKVTHMPTDVAKFNSKLYLAWSSFFDVWQGLQCPLRFMYELYFKKHAVNQFRQATAY